MEWFHVNTHISSSEPTMSSRKDSHFMLSDQHAMRCQRELCVKVGAVIVTDRNEIFVHENFAAFHASQMSCIESATSCTWKYSENEGHERPSYNAKSKYIGKLPQCGVGHEKKGDPKPNLSLHLAHFSREKQQFFKRVLKMGGLICSLWKNNTRAKECASIYGHLWSTWRHSHHRASLAPPFWTPWSKFSLTSFCWRLHVDRISWMQARHYANRCSCAPFRWRSQARPPWSCLRYGYRHS